MNRVTKKMLAESNLSKESYEALIAKANVMGEEAFANGKSNAPAQNSGIMNLCYPQQCTAFATALTCNIMESYTNGWMRSQRAAAKAELEAAGFYSAA